MVCNCLELYEITELTTGHSHVNRGLLTERITLLLETPKVLIISICRQLPDTTSCEVMKRNIRCSSARMLFVEEKQHI